MLSRNVLRMPYRLLQRVIPCEAARVLILDSSTIASTPEVTNHTIRLLSSSDAVKYASGGSLLNSDELVPRLTEDRMWCVGAESEAGLCAFAWFYEGLAERGMNVGYHPATATEIQLSGEAAFVFNVYTAPESRGQGLMPAMLSHAALELRKSRDVRWIVTTTEVTNDAARAGFRKSGFHEQGVYFRFGFGKYAWGWYPKSREPIQGFVQPRAGVDGQAAVDNERTNGGQ